MNGKFEEETRFHGKRKEASRFICFDCVSRPLGTRGNDDAGVEGQRNR